MLFDYGVHATTLSPRNHLLSADWPGAAREELAANGFRAIFVPGPLGDQEPAIDLGYWNDDAQERAAMADFGKKMAHAVEVEAKAATPGSDPAELAALERWVDTPTPQLRTLLRALVALAVRGLVARGVRLEARPVPGDPRRQRGARDRARRARLPRSAPSCASACRAGARRSWSRTRTTGSATWSTPRPTSAAATRRASTCSAPDTASWLVDSAAETARLLDERAETPR